MNQVQPSGAWMPLQKQPMPPVSRWNAVRSGASTSVKASAGGAPIVGGAALTRISSQKKRRRHPLHPAARGSDDHLHR